LNDTTLPDEQPPYLERCKRMTFAELRRFIDHALKRLMGPSSLDEEELPRSELEFLVLCEMLAEKADALKEPPVPQIPCQGQCASNRIFIQHHYI
jgi:hypothetical protein